MRYYTTFIDYVSGDLFFLSVCLKNIFAGVIAMLTEFTMSISY